MSETPAGPSYTAPGFAPCYRHPDRMTGITCQRCGKPICGECMNAASVGFQCPRCVGAGRASVRQPRTRFGASLGGSSRQRATVAVMIVLGAVWLLDLVSRGLVIQLVVMFNPYVAQGELWRLLTGITVSGSIFGVAMNLLVLWLVGRAMESELGAARFLILFVAAGLGGMTLFFLIGPADGVAVGAPAAIFGLLGANAVGKLKSGEDIRPDLGLFGILLLYNIFIGFNTFGWLGLIGGIAVGAAAGAILAYAPRENRLLIQTVGMLAVVVLCLGAVVAKIFVF